MGSFKKFAILGIIITLGLSFLVGCGLSPGVSTNFQNDTAGQSDGLTPKDDLNNNPQETGDSQSQANEQGQDSQNEAQQSESTDYLKNKIIVAGHMDSSNGTSGILVMFYDPDGGTSYRHQFPSATVSDRVFQSDPNYRFRLNLFSANYENLVAISNYNIVLVDMNGNEQNLTAGRYGNGFDDKPKELQAFFSADHSKIVFWASGGLGKPMVDAFNEGNHGKGYWFSMNPDGTGQQLLAQQGYNSDYCASPQGSRMSFGKIIYSGGGDVRGRFIPTVFSRDGKFFAAAETDNWKAVVCSAGGKRLSSCSFSGSIYDWSPNGNAVVGAMKKIEKSTNIYLIPVNNGKLGKPTQLTSTKDRENTMPVFSPDGNKIAFISKKDDLELWVMNRDGTDKRQVATIPTGPDEFDWLRGDVTIMEWTGK